MPTIHTLGHSTRSADELIALLRAFGVRLLVDVRRFPASRRHPHFSGAALAETLRAADIGYVHAEPLGGRRPVLEGSPNDVWGNAGFRGYADYMGTDAFRRALDWLEALASQQPLAVMCAEAVPWRCHRNLLADALVVRGVEVHHILSQEDVRVHELNPAAHRRPDGSLVYEKARRQLDLLE